MNCWVVVPAAGVGRRMQADCPKQYLPLAGGTVIEQTIARLRNLPGLAGIVVTMAADDPYWPRLRITQNPIIQHINNNHKHYHSVLNTLQTLNNQTTPDN